MPIIFGWKPLATHYRISVPTVKNWAYKCYMPRHIAPGGGPMFITEEIDLWLLENSRLMKGERAKSRQPKGKKKPPRKAADSV